MHVRHLGISVCGWIMNSLLIVSFLERINVSVPVLIKANTLVRKLMLKVRLLWEWETEEEP